MNLVLKDTTNFATCYIDDISVYSLAWTEHIDHIREVLTRLQTAGLTLQLSKCKLGAQSCEFLGHRVSARAISPQTVKVEAIFNFQRPLLKKDVRSFLGLIGYYRRYNPQFSSLAAPLSDLTKAQEPDTIQWTDQCQQSFENLKQVLATPPTLAPPDYSKPFLLQTDASDRGIGAVLSQEHDQEEKLVAFFSIKLLDRECRYHTTEKEVVAACKHFLAYLIGTKFTVITDHCALQKKDPSTGRLARWLNTLQDLDFNIQYRPGKSNGNADGLSRQVWPNDDTPKEEREMSSTSEDPNWQVVAA